MNTVEVERHREIMRRSSTIFGCLQDASLKYKTPVDFDLEFLRLNIRMALAGKHCCLYCNKRLTIKNISLDHKLPLSRQGSSSWKNLLLCCRSCNKQKGSMTKEEFIFFLEILDAHFPHLKARILRTLSIGASFSFGAQRRAGKK